MIGKKSVILGSILSTLVLLALFSHNFAQEGAKTKDIAISEWLLLGPSTFSLPALSSEKVPGADIDHLLKFESADMSAFRPEEGRVLLGPDGSRLEWKAVSAAADGEVEPPQTSGLPSVAYLGVYLDVKRWTEAALSVKSAQAFRVFVDGAVVSTKGEVNKAGEGEPPAEGRKTSADLKLEAGVHCLLIKTVFDPSSKAEWKVRAVLSVKDKFTDPMPEVRLHPESRMTVSLLLDGPKVTGVSVSPDGELAAVSLARSVPPTDNSESWVELRQTKDGKLFETYRGQTSVTSVNWAPSGRTFAYVSRDKDKATLWVVDLERGTALPLLENMKNLGSFAWMPDAQSIIYSVSEEGKKDRESVKRFKNLADRQPGWRDNSFLYRVNLLSGLRQRLTGGDLTTSLNSIRPDGKSLLFTRSVIDYSVPSFSKTELYSLNLESLAAEKIWTGFWFRRAWWNPLGTRLLVLGGPSTFGAIGVNVPAGMIPNEYDSQAFLFDPVSKKVEAISRDFNPSIEGAAWSQTRDCIYFVTTDKSFRRLYRYDLDKKAFTLIETGVEVLGGFDLAEKAPLAVYTGSGANVPPKAYAIDLETGAHRVLLDPGKEDFSRVKFGDVKSWTFTNKRGVEIDGHVYYPPDFDPGRKYPSIVYYYGGTTPVDRSFGGRYPKELYAAMGYIVYVLQPSGATGYGQAFSALHVNDWGRITADEIILGVKKFLAAHPFVDPKRVGCMGASFGGFMTMLLQTKTDMFAAAVAHAGISSISSYWGEGFWGYDYSAVATAGSYPWNRKDIYVDRSPLFAADKITTPLLLLHGAQDTNVPSGESTQLYTALKILGREVEYVQVADQDHHIMTYNKRIVWTKTILAWFDRWLKGQPEWWNDLYPD